MRGSRHRPPGPWDHGEPACRPIRQVRTATENLVVSGNPLEYDRRHAY